MNKYAELMNEIERRIEDGSIRGGQKLPSIRDLSDRYGCSKSTVVRAYAELEKRHVVYSVPQSGYYAVLKRVEADRRTETPVLDFSSPAPDPELFPYLDFQHCLNKAIDTYRHHLFTYGTSQGLPSLLAVLVKHLADYQVFARPGQIAISSGVQQALSILSTMPFPGGRRTVLLEQPSYRILIELLGLHGIPAQGIVRTENGIDLDELERLFRTGDIKMFYTIPRFHNPLGTSYAEKTKKAIAELAERYGVYIVEDDYLADLETDSKSDPIHAYAPSRVVYLKSYSKMLFPGLRVGVVVLPPELQETFALYKRLSDIDSSMLSQAALEIYIRSGMFERRKQAILASYRERLARLNEALDACNDTKDVRHARVRAGVHTHIELPGRVHLPTLFDRLYRQKRIVLKGIDAGYLASFEKRPIVKLSITQVAEDRIADGVAAIFDEIRKFKSR
ncbi:PLP-dependent aminotransferase family protein [Paenibacillus flagellatus]|uniref:GntR family transcriptional regulator n=1 Tax=Paenibacillus flagellatus TaxID=2211139 RepID=A0A2V5KC14_9BACL|nr:PLP-dependent aminotransferase family protein [Paenibacillus flagellatus]PYI55694.1 GntR family transcriptional regulator [Paenibacillus flagellatus]